MTSDAWASLSTIRVRLIAAMAAALLPVLILGAIQTALAFNREAELLRDSLASAAQRSAADARARMESADILLETLAPGSVGFSCAQRLRQVVDRIPGYDNLIRFDRTGRVACAAGTVPADRARAERGWFRQLQDADDIVITRDPGAIYSDKPALLAAAPARTASGRFDGALVAVVALSSWFDRLPISCTTSPLAVLNRRRRSCSARSLSVLLWAVSCSISLKAASLRCSVARRRSSAA